MVRQDICLGSRRVLELGDPGTDLGELKRDGGECLCEVGVLSGESLMGESVGGEGGVDLGEEGVVVGESAQQQAEVAAQPPLHHLDHALQLQLLHSHCGS